jgi:hypothetical protein
MLSANLGMIGQNLLAPSLGRTQRGNSSSHPLANINCHSSIVEIGWWLRVTHRSLRRIELDDPIEAFKKTLPLASPGYTQRVKENAKDTIWGWIWISGALMLFLCVRPIYQWAESAVDDTGWIEHSHDTPVWMEDNWIEGEYRMCAMLPGKRRASAKHLLCGHSGDQYVTDSSAWLRDFLPAIQTHDPVKIMDSYWTDWTSVESIFHVLPVEYWGRIDRPYPQLSCWRCQRRASELKCKAIN